MTLFYTTLNEGHRRTFLRLVLLYLDSKYKSIQLILHAFKLYCCLILFLSIILIIAGYNKHVQYEAKPSPRPLLSDQGWIQGTITLTFRDLNDEQ